MECQIMDEINYCFLKEQLLRQRIHLFHHLKPHTQSHILRTTDNITFPILNYIDIPGIRELLAFYHSNAQSNEEIKEVLSCFCVVFKKKKDTFKSKNTTTAGLSKKPVNSSSAPLYYDVIKQPMDLSQIKSNVNNYYYKSKQQFINDFKLMINNCKIYNAKHNIYHTMALELDQYFDTLTQDL
ncbi:hypothetical protein RFI_11359 [Reticulomyxa filosa]|uniref:Bromo domain-containing protein n=1 Tax=Reticulomyxa filosa TaxID=46433 RepID=X6NIG6_RETFI|nr:hypothetical protein RFI_11359 [Reticulomyxa filosa]|eukprot:ETO25776.1 hypothetical protein RFI_11359 [Reticulomyxa filosa]